MITPASPTRALSEFASGLRFEHLPQEVIDMAKMHIVNVVACGVRGSSLTSTRMVIDEYSDMGGAEQSTAFGQPTMMPAATGASLNAHAAYSTMNEDSYGPGVCHPGKATIPAALAVAQREHRSGRDLLTAVVAGIEVGCRVGESLCATPEAHKTRLGWQCTISDSLFGVTAASHLLGLSGDAFTSAMGIAATASGGLHETLPPTYDWPRNAGNAAYTSVMSAFLAQRGMSARDDVLEGPTGHLEMFTFDRADRALAVPRYTDGLGEDWRILSVFVKIRCASYMVHNAIEAAQRVAIDNDVPNELIERVTLKQSAWTAGRDGIWPLTDFNSTVHQTPYAVAVALADRRPTTSVDDMIAHIDDPEVLRLMHRIVAVPDDSVGAAPGMVQPATAILETTDGRRFESRIASTPGNYPHDPLPAELLTAKVRANLVGTLGETGANNLIASIQDLENVPDVAALHGLLHAPSGATRPAE